MKRTAARGRPWIFRMTLSCSKHGYEEPSWTQERDGFPRAHEHTFARLAGYGKPNVLKRRRFDSLEGKERFDQSRDEGSRSPGLDSGVGSGSGGESASTTGGARTPWLKAALPAARRCRCS
jgi:hypothetical protein